MRIIQRYAEFYGFQYPRAGRRERAESVPVIHEKWRRRTPDCLAPGGGDLERLKKEEEKLESIMRRLRLTLRVLQMIVSLLIVALMAQSLVVYSATINSLINATTRVWPTGIEVWSTIVVLSLNAVLMVYALVMISGHFRKNTCIPTTGNLYMALVIISILMTTLTLITCAVLLKTQPLPALPLSKISCILAAQSHRFDHNTICRSHIWAFNLCIIGIVIDVLFLFSIWFMHWRHQTQSALQRSKESIQSKLREFNFEMRSSIRLPSPAERPKPRAYPGRLWRLEWGELDEPSTSQSMSSDSETKVMTYTVFRPGQTPAVSPTYKTYF